MADGALTPRVQGTPQGGPLSPLLSNILLMDLDRELERRGHVFCRYADDCNIHVRTEAAGQRVMSSLTRFVGQRLKLTVNAAKSAVDRPWRNKFLGYSLTSHVRPRLRIAPSSQSRLRCLSRLGVLEPNAAQMLGILRGRVAAVEHDSLIGDDAGTSIGRRRVNAPCKHRRLGTRDEEGAAMVERNGAQANKLRHKSIVRKSSA